MANTVSLEDAKGRWEDVIDRARRGEEWLITDAAGQPVAKLAALSKEAEAPSREADHSALIGLMEGQIKLLPGWDDPLEEFCTARR